MDFFDTLKKQYPHISDNDIRRVVNKAIMFFYRYKYPANYSCKNEQTEPITSFFDITWVLSACDELINKLGFNSAIGYKENGVSWNFDSVEISPELIKLLIPEVGVIG